MSLTKGQRVRIIPSAKDRLTAPFSGFAANGRIGVLTDEVESGAWRVAFAPEDGETKTHYIVLRYRELVEANVRRASSNPNLKAQKKPIKKRGLMGWLGT
jgi:hypothetical protein